MTEENKTKKHNHIADISKDGKSGKGFLQINTNSDSDRKEGWYSYCKICGKPFLDNETFYKSIEEMDKAGFI